MSHNGTKAIKADIVRNNEKIYDVIIKTIQKEKTINELL